MNSAVSNWLRYLLGNFEGISVRHVMLFDPLACFAGTNLCRSRTAVLNNRPLEENTNHKLIHCTRTGSCGFYLMLRLYGVNWLGQATKVKDRFRAIDVVH